MSNPLPVIVQSDDSNPFLNVATSSETSTGNGESSVCGSEGENLLSLSASSQITSLPTVTSSLISDSSCNGASSSAYSTLSTPSASKSLLGADLFQKPASLAMPPPLSNKVKKARNLVNPGMSMVKWMKLQESRDKPQTRKRIPLSEIAKHNTESDCWMVIRNSVYDVTEYIPYHPGGIPELMKGAGMDATSLFNEVHRWVNFESILKSCFLGYLSESEGSSRVLSQTALVPSLLKSSSTVLPTTSFSQNESLLILQVETGNNDEDEELSEENWSVSILNRERFLLKVIRKPPELWMAHVKLLQQLSNDSLAVKFQNSFRRALITFRKPTTGSWNNLGLPLPNNNRLVDSRELQMDDFTKGTVVEKENLTHDVILLGIQPTSSSVLGVPVGFHLKIRPHPADETAPARKYTPVIKRLISGKSENNSNENKDAEKEDNKILYFIIKIYNDGQLTKILGKLEVNSSIELGSVAGRYNPSFFQNCTTLALFAGGSGVTPFVRIAEFLHKRAATYPISRIILIFFNHTERDIIWKEQWIELASTWSNFYFFPVISSSVEGWTGLTGRVNSESLFESILLKALSGEHNNSQTEVGRFKAMLCGSAGFNDACVTMLKNQSIAEISDMEQDVFIF